MMGLAGVLVLSVAASAALAGPKSNGNGSAAYVTDDPCEQQLEQNQISNLSDIYVNLKLPGDEATLLVFTIYENGTSAKNSTIAYRPAALYPADCGTDGNLWHVDLGTTLDPGSYTLEVNYYFGSAKNFSNDSFLVYEPLV